MNKKPVNSNPTKEFFSLLKSIEKNTKNQARISSYNPDDISSFMVEICPIKGVYQHAKFLFQIQLMLYPREFPNVICLSDIYHPNIEHGEDYHNVCLNLFDNWNRSFGLIDVIQGLIFLLYQPNLSDPISSFFNSRNTNEEVFRKNVYTSLHGGIVDGIEFLPNPGIIEYNENVKRKTIVKVDDKIEGKCEENQILNNNSSEERKNDIVEQKEDLSKSEELPIVMMNNNAAQVDKIECQESFTAEEIDVDQVQSELEEETEENLPTRAILSPNAFYSDLICSRYAQPEKQSDNDSDSEICDAFDSYYGETDEDDDDDDDDDSDVEFVRDDDYLSLPASDQDPSAIFITGWRQMRIANNESKVCPAPMTAVILTNILNPFRPMIGMFYLCEIENNNWRYPDQSVYRVVHTDRTLNLMLWLQNVCRWSMRHLLSHSIAESSCDQIMWYSLLIGLSYKVRNRLKSMYNYGSDYYVCLYLK